MRRIALFPADEGGCGYYRLVWPAEEMERHGVPIDNWGANASIPAVTQDTPKGRIPIALTHDIDYDIVIIQRPAHPAMQSMIQLWQKKGVEVVIDLDDNFMRVDPRNLVWKKYAAEGRSFEGIKYALGMADRVVFSTQHLADAYARYVKGRAFIRRNCLPNHAYAQQTRVGEPTSIGWAGFVGTHPTDLQVISKPVRELVRKGHFTFVHVGNPLNVERILGVPIDSQGGCPIMEYPGKLDAMDIGLVPLAINDFNKSKSYLKGLEYMARGIPAVATATDEYRLLEGCTIVDTPKDWKMWIKVQRHNYAERSAEAMANSLHHHIALWAEQWWEAWTGAAKDEL